MKRMLGAVAIAAIVAPTVIVTAASGTAAARDGDPKARRVLVISLPAVNWKDVNKHELPNLNRLLDNSAVADLTNRSVRRDSRLGDGYLTLGAGTRSIGNLSETSSDGHAFEVGERFGADTAGQVYARRTGRAAGHGLVYLDINAIVDRNKKELYDAEIGALGDALARGGWTRAVIANGDGQEASDLVRADAYRQFATPEQRDQLFARALRHTDALVGALLREVDPRSDAVMVVGATPSLRESTLTIAALRAPGVEPGLLRSGTTRRSGFVQLIDMAPTILERVGVTEPDSMEGRPAEVGRGGGSAADRRALLEDADAAAKFRDDLVQSVVVLFVVVQILLVLAALIWLARPDRRRATTIVHVGALASLGLIAAVLLARAVPFDEIGSLAYWSWLLGGSLALAGLYWLARRRHEFLPLMLALGVIVAVFVFDVLVGTPLQFNNPLGYSPRVAGRFSGYGNLAYAALASAAVLLAGLLAHRIGGRRGAIAAIALLGVVFVVDGVPFWGADVGGVLSILPAYAVTAYLLLGVRVRLRTAVLAGSAAVAAVLLFGAYDLTRPSDERTHLGRLFETGGSRGWSGFWTVIQRKIDENVGVFFRSQWLIIVVLVLAFLAYLLARHRERLRGIVRQIPEIRAAFIGFAILSVLGFVLNDSGIAIPGLMLAILNASIITLIVTLRSPDFLPPEEPAAVRERAPVGSRA